MSTLAVLPFNPLLFAKRLKEAGVPEAQAEAQAEALNEALAGQAHSVSVLETQVQTLVADTRRDAEQMATKGDIAELRAELRGEIAEMRGEFRGDIKLLRWMMGILIAGVFALAASVAPLALKGYFGT